MSGGVSFGGGTFMMPTERSEIMKASRAWPPEAEKIELLHPEGAVEYLKKLAEVLGAPDPGDQALRKKDAIELFKKTENRDFNVLAFALGTIFLAQAKVVEFLNSSVAKCGVAIHIPSMMPSPASMLADLEKYLEVFAGEDEFAAVVVLSFFMPIPIKEEQIYCACGANNKIRFVPKKLSIAHKMEINDGAEFVLRQIRGIECNDENYKKFHDDPDFQNGGKAAIKELRVSLKKGLLKVVNPALNCGCLITRINGEPKIEALE